MPVAAGEDTDLRERLQRRTRADNPEVPKSVREAALAGSSVCGVALPNSEIQDRWYDRSIAKVNNCDPKEIEALGVSERKAFGVMCNLASARIKEAGRCVNGVANLGGARGATPWLGFWWTGIPAAHFGGSSAMPSPAPPRSGLAEPPVPLGASSSASVPGGPPVAPLVGQGQPEVLVFFAGLRFFEATISTPQTSYHVLCAGGSYPPPRKRRPQMGWA
jgi:hypothetical protein